jgi:hypothetical protein
MLCGDVRNAFITAPCMEKVYSIAGPEFGQRSGSMVVLRKALYGLRSSGWAFRAHFADFLRSMGLFPTRYDQDVWMRLRDDVDDFKVVAKDPQPWIDKIKKAFVLKSVGPPSYYLGSNYTWLEKYQAWFIGCSTYLTECIRRIEANDYYGGTLYKKKTPLPADVHPELDESDYLDDYGTRKFQTLIGVAQWAVTIGRIDLSFAVSSLS